MKFFTHTYKITFFQQGRFCWDVHGWVEDDRTPIQKLIKVVFIVGLVLAVKYSNGI